MWSTIAVPSFVLPGTVADNVRFLRGKVGEVGLCFFETSACLAYTARDIPQLAETENLHFHIHLPLDLPWPSASSDVRAAHETAHVAYAVFQKARHLHPYCAVLHPPAGGTALQQDLLAAFATAWRKLTNVPLLLENTSDASVANLGEKFLQEMHFGFCLDTGHLLAYNQLDILDTLSGYAQLVHWSAPGTTRPHRHLPLAALAPAQQVILSKMAQRLSDTSVHMLEIFSWEGIVASLPHLEQLLNRNRP